MVAIRCRKITFTLGGESTSRKFACPRPLLLAMNWKVLALVILGFTTTCERLRNCAFEPWSIYGLNSSKSSNGKLFLVPDCSCKKFVIELQGMRAGESLAGRTCKFRLNFCTCTWNSVQVQVPIFKFVQVEFPKCVHFSAKCKFFPKKADWLSASASSGWICTCTCWKSLFTLPAWQDSTLNNAN